MRYEMEVISPWNKEPEMLHTALDCIRHCRKQIQYYIDTKTVKDVTVAIKDIEAYDLILNHNSEVIADHFFKAKDLMRRQGNRFKGNMTVIALLVKKGIISEIRE